MPRDSRGDTVYEGASSEAPNAPIVPGELQPPQLLQQVEPAYPKSLRKRGNDGGVLISGVVAPNGDFIDLSVVRVSGFPMSSKGAEQSALAATSRYKFTPTTLAGKPVAFRVNIDVQYRML